MFNRITALLIIVIGSYYQVSYADSRIESRLPPKKRVLTQEVNQHRLRYSSLGSSPYSLKEERHRFILHRLGLPVALSKAAESRVTIVAMDPSVTNQCEEHHTKPTLEYSVKTTARKFEWSMMAPVKAKISKRFGEGEKKLSQGVVFNVESSQPVHAPIAGEVIFAGPIKDFGEVVMIEKDFENIILLAGINQTTIKQGEKVYRGQKVGAVVKRGWIYLEFRNEGNPIDPQQILVSGNMNEEE